MLSTTEELRFVVFFGGRFCIFLLWDFVGDMFGTWSKNIHRRVDDGTEMRSILWES